MSGDLNGIVQPGRGLGSALMADVHKLARLEEIAGFALVPGTLNLRLPAPLERTPGWWYLPAAEITPAWPAQTGQTGYFMAFVTIARRYRGLAFQAEEPDGPGYPPDQLELLSEAHLRRALGLSDGDAVEVVVRTTLPLQ